MLTIILKQNFLHIWLFKNLIYTLQNNVHMLSFPILQWVHTWKEESIEDVVTGHTSPNDGTFFNKYAHGCISKIMFNMQIDNNLVINWRH